MFLLTPPGPGRTTFTNLNISETKSAQKVSPVLLAETIMRGFCDCGHILSFGVWVFGLMRKFLHHFMDVGCQSTHASCVVFVQVLCCGCCPILICAVMPLSKWWKPPQSSASPIPSTSGVISDSAFASAGSNHCVVAPHIWLSLSVASKVVRPEPPRWDDPLWARCQGWFFDALCRPSLP